MKIKVLLVAIAWTGFMQASVYASGDPANGQTLAMQGDGSGAPCAACHGPQGEGMAAATFPRIAGLDADYALRQMIAFQQGQRVNAAMTMNIDNFDEQQLADLAAYFATLPVPAPAAATVSKEQLALGKKLALEGDWDNYLPPCSSCHGPNNQGVDGNFPGIAGQHASYLKQQLELWQQGQRTSDPVQLMEAIAKRLSSEQIEAVAAYLASQPAVAKQ